ncbi:MAG: 1-phosphofructokinase family hexose kinase [Deltaproteobacteria bacterium]|nr:1-phosphofructokinase family hexose kinase [Deltaproteobacteria bacterium]
MKTIFTLTVNPAVDKNTATDHVMAEHKVRCENPSHESGGGGVNVSRAIKKLGGESTALYMAGGLTGKLLESLLERDGLACCAVPVNGWTRESLTVYEKATGLQYRFSMAGPELAEAELEICVDRLARADPRPDYIVASGRLSLNAPPDFYARVARTGREMGAKVIVDTSGEALRLAIEEGLFLVKPNLRELSDMAGYELKHEEDHEKAAMNIVKTGKCEAVVLSMGASGALLALSEGCTRIRSPVVPIMSKVGAGDSMVAGIVLSLARGRSLPDAVRYGVAAGAAAVMTPGTQLCNREDTERLFRQISL